MDIDWANLRSWNGSKNYAFEELCCQLASCEKMQAGAKFIRNGTPDGGVEGYWILPSGEEYGWQAKFFPNSPAVQQWGQIDNSVKSAINEHPRLKKYYICLPIDLPDSRVAGKISGKQKWDEHVTKWTGWAKRKGMRVEFQYWGKHEIFTRLTKDEHHGRAYFWFNKNLFGAEWFDEKVQVAIANAGARYTPKLNVELEIAKVFDGLGVTKEFNIRMLTLYGEIKRAYAKCGRDISKKLIQNKLDELEKKMSPIFSILNKYWGKSERGIDWEAIIEAATACVELTYGCLNALDEAIKKEKVSASEKETHSFQSAYEYDKHSYFELRSQLSDLKEFAQTSEAQLLNVPAFLLEGDAGAGKTHLFCDVAQQRISRGLPSVLLLGEHFSKEEPWSQIIKMLHIDCKADLFLGALESSAEATGSRAIIFIDALNEGEGIFLWKKYLAGILKTLEKYPNVAIAISVRWSYRDLIIPDGLLDKKLIRDVHTGFAEREYDAAKSFFHYYKIEQPSIPLLSPEFKNPLFLKLLCEGLYKKKLKEIPSGFHGITTIFKFFIDSVNEKLSKPDCLDFNINDNVIEKAIKKLSDAMLNQGKRGLIHEEAQQALIGLLPDRGYEKSILRHMISEGILSESPILLEGDGGWKMGIFFSYQRLSDHIIAGRLLDLYLDSEKPESSFEQGKELWELTKNERNCYNNSGLIEAFSIKIPETTGREFAEIAPHCANFLPVIEAFVESLLWRSPKTISEATRDYINKNVLKYEVTFNRFLSAILTVALTPGNSYNADYLHEWLKKNKIPLRDSWWSVFLHNPYGDAGAADRLIDWAWSKEDKSHINDESIRLCGVALAWFLTTSNRYVRDRATKAMVNLFTGRIDTLRKVIGQFLNVDDPYVLERLYAVAYGCAMRTKDDKAMGRLAKDVYDWVFKDGKPFPHLLLRDYARGVIEAANHRGINIDGIDLKRIRPPYKSEWISKIPSKKSLMKYGQRLEGMPDVEHARTHLYSSIMDHGDFARYILRGDNPGSFEWSSQKLNEPIKPSKRKIYNDFVRSLNPEKRRALEIYQRIREDIEMYEFSLKSKKEMKKLNKYFKIGQLINETIKINKTKDNPVKKYFKGGKFSKKDVKVLKQTNEDFIKEILKGKKFKTFIDSIIPYLEEPMKDENIFDINALKRLILKKVYDMGWTVGRFGQFDRRLTRYSGYGRSTKKSERIGKKYQWIAYYEYLARISDNFVLKGEMADDEAKMYDGPWQINHSRDIDPSCSLSQTKEQDFTHSNSWWVAEKYENWDSKTTDRQWIKNTSELPSANKLIEVCNPEDNSKWLVLESYYNWQQPTPPEEDKYSIPRKEIWYQIRSYFVKQRDLIKVYNWAEKQNFMGRWMPESHDQSEIFLGEYFWSGCYRYFYNNSDDYGWTKSARLDDIPAKILISSQLYLQESGSNDRSINDTIRIHLPTKWLVDKMGLNWNGIEGKYFDKNGVLIAFDPSVNDNGPGALLINKEAFIEFLSESGYSIFWTILGEKRILSGSLSYDDDRVWLEISGAYKIAKGKIIGKSTITFNSRK